MCPPQPVERAPPGPAPTAPGQRRTECAEPSHPNRPAGRSCRPEPSGPSQAQPREQEPERGAWPGPWRPTRADMRLHEPSLCQDPSLRQELASLARGCDFVLPSRFKKRLKAFQQVQVQTKEEPLPPASSQSIPTFYFPRGRPQGTVNVDAVIAKIERTFAQFPHERATMEDMGKVAKSPRPQHALPAASSLSLPSSQQRGDPHLRSQHHHVLVHSLYPRQLFPTKRNYDIY
ncbi:serine/threonine-protein phosphatase 2A regulatory subunit B'' subunit beta-like isoform X1 [Equus asinus]|uniref:serine/threonine-protein phosphatase 2A regulatory subunit B'' subunit beta-like isoform X1 n=1 Tax=Equus asinus TaxID=9793 RepID=UPI0038F7FFA9